MLNPFTCLLGINHGISPLDAHRTKNVPWHILRFIVQNMPEFSAYVLSVLHGMGNVYPNAHSRYSLRPGNLPQNESGKYALGFYDRF